MKGCGCEDDNKYVITLLFNRNRHQPPRRGRLHAPDVGGGARTNRRRGVSPPKCAFNARRADLVALLMFQLIILILLAGSSLSSAGRRPQPPGPREGERAVLGLQ